MSCPASPVPPAQPLFEPLEPRLLLSAGDPTGSDPAQMAPLLESAVQAELQALAPLAGQLGLAAEQLHDEGVRAITWQGQQAYAKAGTWVLGLDSSQAGDTLQTVASQAFAGSLLETGWGGIPVTSVRPVGPAGPGGSSYRLEVSPSVSYEDLLSCCDGMAGFRYLEPDFLVWTEAIIPDDPMFDQLWGLHNTGQTGGLYDADIDAPEAWEVHTGSGDVVVAVIDTGVDYTHPDLAANIWTNPGEVPGDGIDNDANGFIDDVHGWDFCNTDADPKDDHGHGTHCSGTIAAVADNGVGVAGVSWGAEIMALKFLSTSGSGWISDAAAALDYATMMRQQYGVNVRITSNSWGGGSYSQAMADAIAGARNAGILFVAAAGNGADDMDSHEYYPAGYDYDNVLSIAATDHNDLLASFSNYGASTVDLGAPGVAVTSTANGGYATWSGTSMATPHVAGVAALVASIRPSATYQDIRNVILDGTDPLVSLAGRCVTGGRLNAYNAAVLASNPRLIVEELRLDDDMLDGTDGNDDGLANPGERLGLSVSLLNLGLVDADGVMATLFLAAPHAGVTILQDSAGLAHLDGRDTGRLADQFLVYLDPDIGTPEEFTFELNIQDDAGREWTDRFSLEVHRSCPITGTVTLDGSGLADATVYYSGPLTGNVQTDLGGSYALSVIAGTYELYAGGTGLVSTDPVQIVLVDAQSDVDFSFVTATVEGTVTDAGTGVPLAGAAVYYEGVLAGSVNTDADGHYAFTYGYGRSVQLSVYACSLPEYVTSEPLTVTAPPGGTGLDFALVPFSGFEIVDLGVPGSDPWPSDLNDQGQIICVGRLPGSGGYWFNHSWLWDNGELTDLGAFDGRTVAAIGINELGQIAMYAEAPHWPEWWDRAMVWDDGSVADLHDDRWEETRAMDINDSGLVIGDYSTGPGQRQVFIYDGTRYVTVAGPQIMFAEASFLNNLGQAAGRLTLVDGSNRAFLWQDGISTILDTNEGPVGLNDRGEILFSSSLWSDGTLVPLQQLCGQELHGEGLNDFGQIVGWSGTYSWPRPLLWTDGQLLDLYDMIRPGSNWTHLVPSAINNLGQIVGWGQLNGEQRAFLLTPSVRVDRPPTALGQTVELNDVPVEITLQAHDFDDHPLTYVVVGAPAHGTLSGDDGDAHVTYTPEAGYVGDDVFTFYASDGVQDSMTRTVHVIVHGPNTPPTAGTDSFAGIEDYPIEFNVLLNDADADGDSIGVAGFARADHGDLVFLGDGWLRYTPDLDFFGADNLRYWISDGRLGQDACSVALWLEPVDEPPVALDELTTIDVDLQEMSAEIDLPFVNVDGDTLQFIIVDKPRYGTLSGDDGDASVTYRPDPTTLGVRDQFTFKISDGTYESNIGTVRIRVLVQRYDVTPLGSMMVPEEHLFPQPDAAADVPGPQPQSTWIAEVHAYDINDSGQVSGYQVREVFSGWWHWIYFDGFLWDDGVMYYLGTPGGRDSFGIALDEDGVVAGHGDEYGAPYWHEATSFVWQDGILSELGMYRSYTTGMNDQGQIVGTFNHTSAGPRPDGFLWRQGNAVLLDEITGTPDFLPLDINNVGQILARRYTQSGSSSYYEPVVWDDGGVTVLQLGPGDSELISVHINDLGQVCGTVRHEGIVTPVVWTEGLPALLDRKPEWGVPQRGDVLGAACSDLNNVGQVVGNINVGGYGDGSIHDRWQAVLWDGDLVYRLGDLVGDGGLSLRTASAINDRGQIVVEDDLWRSYLLTPIPIPGNHAPVARDDAFVCAENTTLVTPDVRTNDVAANGLRVVDFTQPGHGQVRSNGDGTFIYTPTTHHYGPDGFQYTVTDGFAHYVTANVSINVLPVNTPPVAIDTFAQTREASAVEIVLRAGDFDPEDALTYTVLDPPAHGCIAGDDGDERVTYTPLAGFTGTDTFTFLATDGGTTSNIAICSVLVNDPPVAIADVASTQEDTPIAVDVLGNDQDVNDNPLFAVLDQPPQYGDVEIAPDGKITYTPVPDYSGPDVFSYRASDGMHESDAVVVTVTVVPINDAPVAYDRPASGWMDTEIPLVLRASDAESDAVTYIVLTDPTHGTLSGHTDGDRFLSYTPPQAYTGVDRFTYRAFDGLADSNVATVTVYVSTGTYNIVELARADGGGYSVPVAIDSDNRIYGNYAGQLHVWQDGVRTVYLKPGKVHGCNDEEQVVGGAGPWLWEHGTLMDLPTFGGSDMFARAINNQGVIVGSYRPPPMHWRAQGFVWELVPYTDQYDGYALPIWEAGYECIAYDINDAGVIVGKAISSVGDRAARWDDGQLTVLAVLPDRARAEATAVNEYGQIVGQCESMRPMLWQGDEMLDLGVPDGWRSVWAKDISNSGYVVGYGESYGAFVWANGAASFLKDRLDNAAEWQDLTIRNANAISDAGWIIGGGHRRSIQRALLLVPVVNDAANHAPVGVDVQAETDEDQPLQIVLPVTDEDGDPLLYTVTADPSHGTVTLDGNVALYVPKSSYAGPDQFRFAANDRLVSSVPGSVSITVHAVNDVPVAQDRQDWLSEDLGRPFDARLSASDADGDPLEYHLVDPPQHGTAILDGEWVHYTPEPNFNGADEFTYYASDGQADSNVARFRLTIQATNDEPVASGSDVWATENHAVRIPLSAMDIDGDDLAYAVLSRPQNGSLIPGGDWVIYTPAPGFVGNDSLAFVASDGYRESNVASVAITVVPDATPPKVTAVELNGQPNRSIGAVDPSVNGVQTISVVFDEPVVFAESDVTVHSLRLSGDAQLILSRIAPTSLTGSGTDVMIITLPPGAGINAWLKVTLSGSGSVKDLAGNALDGDPPPGGGGRAYLHDPDADLPSGNGIAGGDAVFYVGSLPGDVDGSTSVDRNDLAIVLGAFGSPLPGAIDLDGDGDCDDDDVAVVLDWQGQSLPALLPGDVNGDGVADVLDIQPFVDLLTDGVYQFQADINGDGVVDGLDIQPFVELITGAGGTGGDEPARHTGAVAASSATGQATPIGGASAANAGDRPAALAATAEPVGWLAPLVRRPGESLPPAAPAGVGVTASSFADARVETTASATPAEAGASMLPEVSVASGQARGVRVDDMVADDQPVRLLDLLAAPGSLEAVSVSTPDVDEGQPPALDLPGVGVLTAQPLTDGLSADRVDALADGPAWGAQPSLNAAPPTAPQLDSVLDDLEPLTLASLEPLAV